MLPMAVSHGNDVSAIVQGMSSGLLAGSLRDAVMVV